MRILPVIEHLKANVPLLQNRVEPATNTMGLNDNEYIDDVPFCFVHSYKETAKEAEVIGSTEQNGKEQFRLLLIGKTLDLDSGTEPMEDLRDEVRLALAGWRVSEGHGEVEFLKGEIIGVDGLVITWADIYQVERCWD